MPITKAHLTAYAVPAPPQAPPLPSWHSGGPTAPLGLGRGSSVHLGDCSFRAQAFCWAPRADTQNAGRSSTSAPEEWTPAPHFSSRFG